MANRARVLIDCKDQKGLVFKISKIFYDFDLNIVSNREFVDKKSGHFFMRSVITGDFDAKELEDKIKSVVDGNAIIKVAEPAKKNIILMATKESHALGDILIRYLDGELDANIIAVIANRDKLRSLVERFNIPFIYINADGLERQEHEALVLMI